MARVQPVWRWMEQLAFLVLFAGLVEIALPSGDVRKAVRLLAGLVVMLAVVEPFTVSPVRDAATRVTRASS